MKPIYLALLSPFITRKYTIIEAEFKRVNLLIYSFYWIDTHLHNNFYVLDKNYRATKV